MPADRGAPAELDGNKAKTADFVDDVPTQVFEELSEKIEPATNKSSKTGRAGDRARKVVKTGARKTAGENLETQVFEELSEKIEPASDKSSKTGRAGGRARKVANTGARKTEGENLDDLQTQVFDSFVPLVPITRKSGPLQSDHKVVMGDRVDGLKTDVATGGRRTRGRMSLKSSHKETPDITTTDKFSTAASGSDVNIKVDTDFASMDDLATQVFEDEASTSGISAIPPATSCVDNAETQTFDDGYSLPNTIWPHKKVSVSERRDAVSSGSQRNLKSHTSSEDVEPELFEDVVDTRGAVSSRSSKSKATGACKRTTSVAAGRQAKKSTRRKQADSVAADNTVVDQMDDLATQVFDAVPQEKPAEKPFESGNISGPSLSRPGADDSDNNARKPRKSFAIRESVETTTKPVEEMPATPRDAAAEANSTSRRLSCRGNKGRHRAREASLSSVPADADLDEPPARRTPGTRANQTNPSAVKDTSGPASVNQLLLICDARKADEITSSSSSEVAEDTDAGKRRAVRSRGKRVTLNTPSGSPVTLKEVDEVDVGVESPAKPPDRRRNKKEPARMAGKSGKLVSQSRPKDGEPLTSVTDEDEVPAGEQSRVSRGKRGNQDGKKTRRLYTPRGFGVCLIQLYKQIVSVLLLFVE